MSDEYVEGPVPIPEKTNIVEKVISAAKSFASKGLDNKYCSENTKSLRIFSCHGDGKFHHVPIEWRVLITRVHIIVAHVVVVIKNTHN